MDTPGLTPEAGPTRSILTLISHLDADQNKNVFDQLKAHNVHVAFRQSNLRVSPHLFNSQGDIDKLLALLEALA